VIQNRANRKEEWHENFAQQSCLKNQSGFSLASTAHLEGLLEGGTGWGENVGNDANPFTVRVKQDG
jgi:hypothetical protein